MATEGNGGLGSSEEVREGQLMDPELERKQMHGLDRRNLQLRFHQSMFPDSFFTERNVEGQDGAPIHVKLIDTSTGDVVRSGPLSCVKLKVVVVEGDFNNEDADDWTREDFERRVVKEREGKRLLLIGNLSVSLEGGVGSLGKFSFTDNSSWTRSKKFRLGLKVALDLWGGIRVREAITNPFAVKDRRGKVYEKHYPPALDDEVWRLESIGKNGPFHKRLDSKGISKVKDFLWKLGTDAQGLRKILGSSMNDKTWDTLIEHAKTCDLSGKYHVYYADETKNSGVVFKNIYELYGLIEGGKYYSAETLSDSQEVFADTLKKKAYAKWKDVVEYDGLLPLEMNPSKRSHSSQTEVVAPESCPSDTDQRVSPAFLTHVAHRPGLVNSGPAVGDDFCNRTVDRGSSSLVSENSEYGSGTAFSSIGDMVSVLSGKYCVYYANNTKNSGVVFKIMSDQLCGLIEGGKYNSAETLSDRQKMLVDMLVKNACENSMHVVEYDDRMLLNMKQSKRTSSSRTEVVIEAPQFSLPPLPSSVPLEQTSMNSVVVVGAEEQHVTRALDDDIFTLNGTGKDGPFLKKLKAAGISQVKDWKLGLDPEGLRKILGKTVSDENWKTLGDHANESVPRGKSHVYYADETKNSGVVFKNMAELCGLIEHGESYSAKTLSDEQKLTADTLKKEAGDKWKDIVEYDGLQLLEMNPSERARSSQTDVVIGTPDSSPSGIDLASSSYVDPSVNPGLHIGAPIPCQPPSSSVHSGEASENSMPDFEDFFSCLLQDDSIDWTSPFQQDLLEKTDGNTSLDAFGREADRSDSHLPGSSLDPPEQAGGNAVLFVGAHGGSFERGGGSNPPWIEEGVYYSQQPGGSQFWSQSDICSGGGYYGNGNVQFGGIVNRKIIRIRIRRLTSNFGGLSVERSVV